MERRTEYRNDYVYAAIFLASLSIIGSLLSVVNIITLLLTYGLLKKAEVYSNPQYTKISSYIFQTGLLATLIVSILYLTIKT